MNGENYYIARKYAIAFMNVFGSRFDKDACKRLADMAQTLRKRSASLVLLSTPCISHNMKHQALKKLLPQQYSVGIKRRPVSLSGQEQ